MSTYALGGGAVDEDALLRQYGGLVDRLARRTVARTGMPSLHDDLWSAGAIGLLEAARRFDATRAVAFETFAEQRIRGAMLDELRRHDHLPRRLRSQTNDIETERRRMATALGREPTTEELAVQVDLSIEELGELETVAAPHVSLEWALALATAGGDDPAGRVDLGRKLTSAIEALPERLRVLLSLIYVEDLTYAEVAALLEISKPRVSQLHTDAIAKLREAMGV
jgi:RNA polymerase sigma factor for flagellar operon FliA